MQLEGLAVLGRPDKLSLEFVASSDLTRSDVCKVGHGCIYDHLERLGATAIGQFNEHEFFATHARRFGPTTDRDQMLQKVFVVVVEGCNADAPTVSEMWHWLLLDGWVPHEGIFEVALISCVLGSSL